MNRELAEDLTSQCFLRFAKEISSKDVENPKAYLFGIAKNLMLDFLRNKYKLDEQVLDEELEIVEEEEPEIHILEHLEKILPELPVKQAEVLRLRFIEKLSLSEIAQKLAKNVNYVSTTQKRGFQSIRKLLGCTDDTTNI